MKREYHRWYSPSLARDMELLVFGHSGARVIIFPTRAGRFFDYENWGLVASVSEKIEQGHLQLFCLDSVDAESFYCDWCRKEDRIARHQQYERYVLDEVLPLSEQLNRGSYLIAHGCSLGAYHALNISLRHPERFNKAVSFSGRYDLTANIGSYRDLFDGYHDERIYFHNPSHYVPNLHNEDQLNRLRKLELVIVSGQEDVLLENNIKLSETLWSKGIWHRFDIWEEEAHRARYWRKMAQMYL